MRSPWWRSGGANAAAAAIALWLVAAAAAANVFVEDRREQRDGRLPMFRSVGMLVHPRTGGGGTAFLVSRCHVVTAYHVAFMKQRDPVTGRVETFPGKVGHTVEFVVGPRPEAPGTFGARARATVVAFGRFSDGSFEGMAGDWAILRLDPCLGREFGFLKYARPAGDSPMPTGALMTIGFPARGAGSAGLPSKPAAAPGITGRWTDSWAWTAHSRSACRAGRSSSGRPTAAGWWSG